MCELSTYCPQRPSPCFPHAGTPAFLNVCEFFQNLTGIYSSAGVARPSVRKITSGPAAAAARNCAAQ